MERKEVRFNPISLRVNQSEEGVESRTITGTAIVFNSQSELLNEKGIMFYETILPEAITPELIAESDIVMLYNHKQDEGVLARSKKGSGTLNVMLTDTGVDFWFEAPNSSIGDNVLESVKRGDLDACSFAFYIANGGDEWSKVGEVYSRTIKKIALLTDFSIVVNPAYSATSCNSRGLDEFIEAEKIVVDETIVNERFIEVYYANLRNIINAL